MKQDAVTGVSAPRALPNMRTICSALVVAVYFMRKQEIDVETGMIRPEHALNERQLLSNAQTFVASTSPLLHFSILCEEADMAADRLSGLEIFADLTRFYDRHVRVKAAA